MTRYETQLAHLVDLASSPFHRGYAKSRALELESRGNGIWKGIAQALDREIAALDTAQKQQKEIEVKQDITRLVEMLKRMDAHEQQAQIFCGDCPPEGIRAGEKRDAGALRALLAAQEVAAC